MSERPVVAVVGATGAQGQGAVDALLKQGKYQVRGLTRDLSSQKAKDLASKGVEVVEANLTDKASLVKAFQGADAVFLVTDCVSVGFDPEAEVQQGKNAAAAAKEAGVKHIVFSSLEDFRSELPPNHGLVELEEYPGYCIPHFEAKGQIWEFISTLGVPATQLVTCCFFDNFMRAIPYMPQEDGSYVFGAPLGYGTKLPMHDVKDIGASAAVVLEHPSKYVGATVPVVSESLTFPEVADILSSVTGKAVKFYSMPLDQYAALPFPGAADLGNMWAMYDFGFFEKHRPRDKALVKGLTFRDWAEQNKDALAARISG